MFAVPGTDPGRRHRPPGTAVGARQTDKDGLMLKGFKDFLMRGNVVDLAVAVAVGAAFSGVVKGLLDGLVNPLVAAVVGATDISGFGRFTINKATFSLGVFLQSVLNFVLVAATIYFVIIVPMNRLAARRKHGAEPEPQAPSEEVLLLTEIRDELRVRT
jgi:large conductance mechanosensitive channel